MCSNSNAGRGRARLRRDSVLSEGFPREGKQWSPDPWRRLSPSVDMAGEHWPAQGQKAASRTLPLSGQRLFLGGKSPKASVRGGRHQSCARTG